MAAVWSPKEDTYKRICPAKLGEGEQRGRARKTWPEKSESCQPKYHQTAPFPRRPGCGGAPALPLGDAPGMLRAEGAVGGGAPVDRAIFSTILGGASQKKFSDFQEGPSGCPRERGNGRLFGGSNELCKAGNRFRNILVPFSKPILDVDIG